VPGRSLRRQGDAPHGDQAGGAIANVKRETKEECMNKAELINEVAEVLNSKKEAQAAVDCVLNSITNALKKGDTVTLVGFGTFKVVKREARTGRNPQTGAPIKIPARKVVRFKAGKELEQKVK
jgi:DNA-binding protein HU-beta